METSDEPISIGLLLASGASTAAQIQAQQQQGKAAKGIGEARAAIDDRNAEVALKRGIAAGKLKIEEGRRALASNRARTAASGINVNVGSPVVIATQSRANVLRDANFLFEGGSVRGQQFTSSAGLERATGRHLRDQARTRSLQTGIEGTSDIVNLGIDDFGWFGGRQDG